MPINCVSRGSKVLYTGFFYSLALLFGEISCTSSHHDQSTTHTADQDLLEVLTDPELTADSTLYIDPVSYNEDSNEVIIDLYYQKDYSEEAYEALVHVADTLVYSENEVSRKRIPLKVAQRYLDMRGLEKLSLFTRANKPAGTASFVEVDLYEDPIESKVVGVFKLDEPPRDKPEFCTTLHGATLINTSFNPALIDDPGLDRLILESLPSESENVSMRHYQIGNDHFLSFVNQSENIFIFEINRDTVNVRLREENVLILEEIPLGISYNDKPLLLVISVEPETDFTWTALYFYDGTHYEIASHNRIDLKK